MCGIFGVVTLGEIKKYSYRDIQVPLEHLFRSSLRRGSEAAGLMIYGTNGITTHTHVAKVSENAKHFLTSPEYKNLLQQSQHLQIKTVIGHARLATNGSSKKHNNNQPVLSADTSIIGVHNGIITNTRDLIKEANLNPAELDTQVVIDYIEHQVEHKKATIEQAIQVLLGKIKGTVNLALVCTKIQKVVLVTNHGSLYIAFSDNPTDFCFFSSELPFLKQLAKNALGNSYTLRKININTPYIFDLHKKIITQPKHTAQDTQDTQNTQKNKTKLHFHFKKDSPLKAQVNSLAQLKKHTIDTKRIATIPRCKRCILPITTPFIVFDDAGVCNYCHEHTKITYKGRAELDKVLQQYQQNNKHKRRPKKLKKTSVKNSKPDCLVAFSGGRDSSYGLHLIKNELGMNPIAYTYDWGMISDLGRRNQARVLQKLGVEQIVISADIAMKRRHIRKNILAWIKNPHLGMVPLFMQGDKQCEFYADRIIKEYDIPLMFYCRGNELEKEEFKTGHCGVRDADPGGVIHDLAWKNKLKLLGFYGLQYAKNPAYFNESIFDTAFAYFSTYVQPHKYVYLWHYLPWNEETIVRTLTKEYDWELSPETSTSWRIGDGTPAFYNYIYYQVQGFTENDSLRARQVREGILNRDRALELVFGENAPQYENLKWYFDTLELDGDAVLEVVDGMERLY